MAPAVLNAANEVAVEAFLAGRLGFLQIAQLVAETLEMAEGQGCWARPRTWTRVLATDAAARRLALNLLGTWGTECRRALSGRAVLLCRGWSGRLLVMGIFGQGLGGIWQLPVGSAAVPVRADGRRVHSRARPFPGRALVRREGQGLLHRLRQGDFRLLRPLRHPLAASPGSRSAATSSFSTTRTAPAFPPRRPWSA